MIAVINTGGTFNKIYDKVKGELVIHPDNEVIESLIAQSFYDNLDLRVTGLIYKDSLYMDDNDRATLCQRLEATKERDILIIHGTDTVDKSAQYIKEHAPHLPKSKRIVFTGAMKPFSIEPAEASSNFTLGIGFLLYANAENGIYIALNGILGESSKVIKDRTSGKFIFA